MNGVTGDHLQATYGEGESRPRSAHWGRWLAGGLLLAFLVLMGIGVLRAQAGQRSGGPAPNFSLPLYNGGTFRLSEQRGKVVIQKSTP